MKLYCIFTLVLTFLMSCGQQQTTDQIQNNNDEIEANECFDLDEIQQSGELIVLTISGPQTCYDYHGTQLGAHIMLCQQLADTLGVRLRIELCRDTVELRERLAKGDADLVAYPMKPSSETSPGWLLDNRKKLLNELLTQWYGPWRIKQVSNEEGQLLAEAGHVRRHAYAVMENREAGIISRYDALFQKYARTIHWDWRLLAAQCYQESTFDPHALSFAGAKGLMQIMPQTADYLNIAHNVLDNPEQNLAAAVKYIAELDNNFNEIHDRRERQNFVLAAYNGGWHHVRDAMALARRDGKNNQVWNNVSDYVLKLSSPTYYQDPLVKYGYMRGQETVDYVRLIRERFQQYRSVKAVVPNSTPQKSKNAKHRNKYKI